jgi:hypothetical protein
VPERTFETFKIGAFERSFNDLARATGRSVIELSIFYIELSDDFSKIRKQYLSNLVILSAVDYLSSQSSLSGSNPFSLSGAAVERDSYAQWTVAHWK